ncbi:ATP-binding protein [Saccharomonospora sp. NPDC046836]|uniref:ATP-binding protein n=1 Tax=Saccharomonospora sp. NPDC046836 TaxID=3156921 RepID=UPI0033CFFB39
MNDTAGSGSVRTPALTLDGPAGNGPPPLAAVRRWIADLLADLGEDHRSAVLLVATELVTNAYAHTPGPVQLRLRRELSPCCVHVEVDDRTPYAPAIRIPEPGTPGGRGLLLVDRLANAWGSSAATGSGKTVWAIIDCGSYPWAPCA